MPTAFQTAMAARYRSVLFNETRGNAEACTITSGEATADSVQAIVTHNPVVPMIGQDESTLRTGSATINKADITLSAAAAGDYGTLTQDADGTAWRITRIERESRASYHVALALLTTHQYGRTALPSRT